MEERLIERLLQLSNDLVLEIDESGRVSALGHHFHELLLERRLSLADLEVMVGAMLPQLLAGTSLLPPLADHGIVAGPFHQLWRSPGKICLLAADRTPMQSLVDHLRTSRQREEQFHAKDERIHVLLDESSDPIFSFDADGTYLYINRIFADTIGRRQEEVIGKKIWDVFSQEEADKRFAVVRQVFASGETATIEVRVPLPAGGEKYYLTTVKPIKNDDRSVRFVICISKEITELRRAKAEIAELRGIIPICASCKNIRDDAGYWRRIEEYIASHSAAEFSHGLCPDCLAKLYPEYAERVVAGK